MLSHCVSGDIDKAYQILKSLWDKGYSPHDIITNIFRVCKNHPMAEYIKLEYIKVNSLHRYHAPGHAYFYNGVLELQV